MSADEANPRAALRVLVICTANACRSPVVEQLVNDRLAAHGIPAVVRSAGTHGGPTPVHRYTSQAAAEVGLDLSNHRPRRVTAEILADEGSDLVLTMTRIHSAAVSELGPGVADRTFTLPELVRLAESHGIDPLTSSPQEWVAALARDRKRRSSVTGGQGTEADDVADPYSGPRHGHRAMVKHVDRLVRSWLPLLAGSIDPAFTDS